MKYWKEIRNQRSVWLFAGGFVLLLGVMTGMLYTLGRRGIIPICGITAALLAMAISYTAELRCNIGRRRALENMLADGDTDYLEPEEKTVCCTWMTRKCLSRCLTSCMRYLFHER